MNCEVEGQSDLLMCVSDLKGYCWWRVLDLMIWSEGGVWCTGKKIEEIDYFTSIILKMIVLRSIG